MKKLSRGILLAIEGIDGSGKTTMGRALAAAFDADKVPVILTKEPGGTPLGISIRHLLYHSDHPLDARAELLLYATDRAQHCAQVIKPALAENTLVITDRFVDSTRAYQGYGRQLDRELVETTIACATSGLVPDITLYCAVGLDTAFARTAARRGSGDLEPGNRAFHERVLAGFEEIFLGRDDVIRVDGTLPPDELACTACRAVTDYLTTRGLLI